MKSFRRRAFTLAELLIVVIVIAVLAGVAVPKFSTVLESRKTAEADQMLAAVRLEQEKRCMTKGQYLPEEQRDELAALSSAKNSAHYNYTLGYQGAQAASKSSKKQYTLKMLSYRDGRICCSGNCSGLTYEDCGTLQGQLSAAVDECALPEPENLRDACETNPNSCECAAYAAEHPCECAGECDACAPSVVSTGWSSTEAPLASADSCDGDIDAQYTCDGVEERTCNDVFSIMSKKSEMRVSDPFNAFRNSILLAVNEQNLNTFEDTLSDVYLGDDLVLDQACRTDDDCATLGGTCKNGKCTGLLPKDPIEPGEPSLPVCTSPKQYNAISGQCECTNNCSSPFTQNDSTCECECTKTCSFGTLNTTTCMCERDISSGEPVITTAYLSRTVTCCAGQGGTKGDDLDSEEPNTNLDCRLQDQLDCENSGGVFNTQNCTCDNGGLEEGNCTGPQPEVTVKTCGNCYKGYQATHYECDLSTNTWVAMEGPCVIDGSFCTPGTKKAVGGATCTGSPANKSVTLEQRVNETVVQPGESTGESTYDAGMTCDNSCTWVANSCPSSGSSGGATGGGGGGHGGDGGAGAVGGGGGGGGGAANYFQADIQVGTDDDICTAVELTDGNNCFDGVFCNEVGIIYQGKARGCN